jgi:glycosyltransferase involved in cell wall biosynthesis
MSTNPSQRSQLSVVVPVFNEVENIRASLELLLSEVEPHFSSYEILVVSDGSTDGTNQVLRDWQHPRVRPIIFERNRGKGFVVREGFRAATGTHILFIDGGMELHPREIRIFLGLMDLYQADVVIGSKRHPQSKVDYPTLRRVLSFVLQKIVKRLFDLDVTDTQVGLKLFRSQVIAAILPDLQLDRYGFDLEVLALARMHGFTQFLEAPIQLDYFSRNTRSTLAELVHVCRVGVDMVSDVWKLHRRIRKLKGRKALSSESSPGKLST